MAAEETHTNANMEEEKNEANESMEEEENVASFTTKGSPRLAIRQMVRLVQSCDFDGNPPDR